MQCVQTLAVSVQRDGVNSTSESLLSEDCVLPDVEGVLAVMDRKIVLLGLKEGHPPAFLRPVHTKHDNYIDNDKDIVLKIVLNIKE